MMEKSYPVLYSFRRCPYAMRARMALFISQQTCTLREVVLKNKPDEMIEASAKGTVPVLEMRDGNVLDESLDIMLWTLGNNDPAHWLSPPEGCREEVMDLIDYNDNTFKGHLDRYKYPARFENANPAQSRLQGTYFIRSLNDRLSRSPYLFGDKPCLADFAIAPFIRQFANTDRAWFDQTPYQATQIWLTEFTESVVFLSVMKKYPPWQTGDEPTLSEVPRT